MADTPELLPKSREHFRNYLKAKKRDIFDAMREYNVGYGRPYAEFYRSNEVVDCIRSIYHNLDEKFGYLRIPEDFASPKRLVQTWKGFYDYLVSLDELFSDISTALETQFKTEHPDDYEQLIKAGFMYPPPLTAIDEIRQDLKTLLEHILEMEEVTEILDKIYGNTNGVKGLHLEKGKKEEIVDFNWRKDSFDIVIITALHDTEFEAILNLPIEFEDYHIDNDGTDYRKCNIGNTTVLVATDDVMGMAAAASLTTKLIAKFSPKYIIMAGIAGGVKDKDKSYGDILVARWSFNYDSGKYKYNLKKKQSIFEPNPEQIELSANLVTKVNHLKTNQELLKEIHDSFPVDRNNKQPNANLKVFVGPVSSGSAVIADEKKIDTIRAGNRKLIGLDMETYGVMYSAKSFSNEQLTKAISIKSISDFADQRKSDKYRRYAAYTSSNFIYQLILNELQNA